MCDILRRAMIPEFWIIDHLGGCELVSRKKYLQLKGIYNKEN